MDFVEASARTPYELYAIELLSIEIMRSVPTDPLNDDIGGIPYRYYYQSIDGTTYLMEYYLETNSVTGRSQGLNTASP